MHDNFDGDHFWWKLEWQFRAIQFYGITFDENLNEHLVLKTFMRNILWQMMIMKNTIIKIIIILIHIIMIITIIIFAWNFYGGNFWWKLQWQFRAKNFYSKYIVTKVDNENYKNQYNHHWHLHNYHYHYHHICMANLRGITFDENSNNNLELKTLIQNILLQI